MVLQNSIPALKLLSGIAKGHTLAISLTIILTSQSWSKFCIELRAAGE